jgi:hypothetical protein
MHSESNTVIVMIQWELKSVLLLEYEWLINRIGDLQMLSVLWE